MSDTKSLVSCIMPTYNRRAFVPYAIRYFLRQDYPDKELIIIDDGSDNISDLVPVHECIRYYRLDKKITLGAKLNLACNYVKGDFIAHWDDDDWYAPWRLSYQVEAMKQKGIALCGINELFYYSLNSKEGFRYIYPSNLRVWLSGSSLCYSKDLWKTNAFADINIGMDGLFVWAASPGQIKVLEDNTFSVHMIHDHNVSPKKTSGGYWHPFPIEKIRQFMKDDWDFYNNGAFHPEAMVAGQQKATDPRIPRKEHKLLKNVYACLVHECEDCIIDLVRNLHYHDPSSVILLYNGSNNPNLLSKNFPYEKYGAVIHPAPVPQRHGYLHTFALDCMEYALENFSFDIFTNVDSDQLCIRTGYPEYMSQFFSTVSDVGMLSSNPDRILPDNKINFVAGQAYKEYDLWKPFLQSFPDGESKFVHWTFWPSTVFTSAALKDLVAMFKENKQLQDIMKQTKIWATEEVIFPTLIRLLGYEIAVNPCSYDFVKYRKNYTTRDINAAVNKADAYWIHPVERRYDDPLRTYTRKQFKEYALKNNPLSLTKDSGQNNFLNSLLIEKIRRIEGWLNDHEADLLIELADKVCKETNGIHNIVEIGSYHGKSTVLFGTVLKDCQSPGKVFAIDMHDGQLGATDQGLKSYPPSFEKFKKNIADANLGGVVEIIKDKATNVKWKEPVSLLFIDGLHDYPNVANDFWHFEGWISKGGYVAFHDYADYYPGVKTFVDELLNLETFKKIKLTNSLIVLQKN